MEMAEGKPRELELILIAETRCYFDVRMCIEVMCSVTCRYLLLVQYQFTG